MSAWVQDRLERSFKEAGWEICSLEDPASPDLLCRWREQAYAVEIRVSAEQARGPMLKALLADSILRARAKAAKHGARPLPIIAAPAISDRIVKELHAYMESYAEGMDWGLLDAEGRFEIQGAQLQNLSPPEDRQGVPSLGGQLFPKQRPAGNPFSDLGQWMLKVLLAHRLPKSYWLNANHAQVRSSKDLAEIANVSIASASKHLKALEEAGFLERHKNRGLRLVRIPLLMEAWRNASNGPWKEIPARFMIPGKDAMRQLSAALVNRPRHVNFGPPDDDYEVPLDQKLGPKGSRACLALFAAAESAYASVVRGAPAHLYVENLSDDLLQELGVIQVEHPSEANLFVRQPNFPESVFRGAVPHEGVNGAPAADLIQCWIDVSNHPARGEEQAELLASMLNMGDWSQ